MADVVRDEPMILKNKFEEQLTLGALRSVRVRLVSGSPWKSHMTEARRYASFVIGDHDRPASVATWIQRLTQVVD
jgi:hypothetical protein